MRLWRMLIALGCCVALACTPKVPSEREGLGDAGAQSADAGDGLEPSPRGYAVVSSDYESSLVSLLDAKGTVLRREFIHSGSASAGLVTALSGDVVLPTRSGERGVLVLIDRLRTDVVTRIDLASGDVLSQLKTHAPNTATESTYSSNPRDYLFLDAHSAWVSRYEPNLDPDTGKVVLGADLLRIDPERAERTDERIVFTDWDTRAPRENPDTGAQQDVTVYARPSNLVRLGEHIAVGIDALSQAFDANDDAMVALIEIATRKVHMLRMDGLQGCGELAPVPNDDTAVAVACSGSYRSTQRTAAGIGLLRVKGHELVIEQLWRAQEEPKAAVAVYGLVALDATTVIAAAAGNEASGTFDVLYRMRLDTGAQQKLLQAKGRYVLGQCAYDARTGLLLVPDASVDDQNRPIAGVHLLQQTDDGRFELRDTLALDDVLPPRQIRAFE